MSILHTRQVSGWARGHLLCRVEDRPGRFAVTFDDGPNPAATGRILDVLARHGAHATFFMLGGHVRRHGDLARRVLAEGHEAAIHGENHWPVPLLLPGGIRRTVLDAAAAIEEATGVSPRFYRPPFGFMSPGQARFVRNLGYEPVLGDVYPEDPHSPGVERIVKRVMARLCAGSILILHDGSPVGNPSRWQTVEALVIILASAGREGLRGTTIAALDPPVSKPKG